MSSKYTKKCVCGWHLVADANLDPMKRARWLQNVLFSYGTNSAALNPLAKFREPFGGEGKIGEKGVKE